MQWLPYSLASTLFVGFSLSLYKLPSFKGYSSFVSTLWSNVFAAVFVFIALAVVAPTRFSVFGQISWYAVLWGALFAGNMILLKIILRDIETGSVYPVTSSLGSVFTVAIGVVVLQEHITILQALGIAVVFGSVYLYTSKGGSYPLTMRTVLLSFGALMTSTASKYVQKLGAVHESVERFMSWQYVGAAFFALLAIIIFERSSLTMTAHPGRAIRGSFFIGLFTALGGYAILRALAFGPLSGVFAIHPTYTFIAAFVGWAFFKESFTFKKFCLALASIAGIILIKIG